MQSNADVSMLVDEYHTLVYEARRAEHADGIRQRLMDLLILLDLAEQYGTFALRNALALSIALGIEDGSLGY